jgi:hypothetical protein
VEYETIFELFRDFYFPENSLQESLAETLLSSSSTEYATEVIIN